MIRSSAMLRLVLGLGVLAAIASTPAWTTQDGPAHLYNAHILDRLARGDGWWSETFAVRAAPVPNWAGHLVYWAGLRTLPVGWVERAVSLLSLVAFAAAAWGLRWKVAGPETSFAGALLCWCLATNQPWLMGFTGFVLGATLFALTLSVWWSWRDRLGPGHAALLGGLLALGYFCHLVSLALTAFGLVVLAVLTPGPNPRRRLVWTLGALVPLVPLGLLYRRLASAGGSSPLLPSWDHPLWPPSPAVWSARLTWVDPLTLASKSKLPFLTSHAGWHVLLAPVLGIGIGLGLWILVAFRSENPLRSERRGWWALAVLLILGGVFGPDSMGTGHGHYLPQRLVLLGLVALLPALGPAPARRLGIAVLTLFALAWTTQTLFLLDYANLCRDRAGAVLTAGPSLGTHQRIASLWIEGRVPFISNPLLHSDGRLGVDGDHVVWDNYETAHYYFPIRFVPGLRRPPAEAFETLSRLDGPDQAERRRRGWSELLETYHDVLDRIVMGGRDPVVDRITSRWYDVVHDERGIRIWSRRVPSKPDVSP